MIQIRSPKDVDVLAVLVCLSQMFAQLRSADILCCIGYIINIVELRNNDQQKPRISENVLNNMNPIFNKVVKIL